MCVGGMEWNDKSSFEIVDCIYGMSNKLFSKIVVGIVMELIK